MARDYTKPNSKTVAIPDLYSDLDITFERHPVTNDVVLKKDSDAIKRSLKNILLTNDFERPFKPNFGANLRARPSLPDPTGPENKYALPIFFDLDILDNLSQVWA